MSGDKRAALEAAAGPVSRETFDRLLQFEALFRMWSAHINLTSETTLADLWTRHIVDSAQLLPFGGTARRWFDLGSGGGFPGAVLAILLAERDDVRVSLVESNRKKAAFLRTALGDLAPGATILAERIEAVVERHAAPDIVTARALAPLDRLLDLIAPWSAAGTRALLHKGREYAAEIQLAHDRWNLDLVKHRSVASDDAVILEIIAAQRK